MNRENVALLQQSPNCSDFDVVLSGETSPAFRVLLPENVRAKGFAHRGGLHSIPGTWNDRGKELEGTFLVSDALRVGVAITKGKTDITVALRLTNLLNQELGEVCVDICASLNHLPGNPGWCNRFFLGDAPLDRYVQGRIWYERISPHRLHAFTETGWVPMHPSPDAPSSDAVPQYNFLCSETADAFACAVQSPDDRFFFFQAWNTPCFYLTPCPGNACMHLEPLVARRLAPGEEAEIRALIGMYEGNRESLTARINQFREAGL